MQSQAQASQASEAGPSQQPDGQQAQERPRQGQSRQELPKNYVANMLGAIGALQKHEKYALILDCTTSAVPPSFRNITLQNTKRVVETVTLRIPDQTVSPQYLQAAVL